jgi:hypothetical protein
MDWKAFFDVLDHLASHFGGRGRVKSWKKNFRFWISDFFEGGQGVPRSLKWAYACFFTFNETTDGRGRGGTLETS